MIDVVEKKNVMFFARKNGPVDPAVEQPLANLLWAAPFLAQDIPEMIQITNMFKKHFGIE